MPWGNFLFLTICVTNWARSLHKEGVVVPKDTRMAKMLYKEAAKKGNSNALLNLGLMKIDQKMHGDVYDDEDTDDEEFNPQECLVQAAKKGNERARDILGSKIAKSMLENITKVRITIF